MPRTRVKICGITCLSDAIAAAAAGADAIGLIFYAPSKRAVSIEQAQTICQHLPPFISTVAVTVNADDALLHSIINNLPIDLLQFHGDEAPEYCQSFDQPYIKAIPMRPDIALNKELTRYDSARGLLLDTHKENLPGGTGETFDWDRIPPEYSQRIILAGGLNPDNIERAITTVHPFAVDIASGVEVEPGIKDHAKISALFAAVKRADNNKECHNG